MARPGVERRLLEVADRLTTLRADLDVAEDQLRHFADITDETRLRSLVSETALADQEFHEAERHSRAMQRHRDEVRQEIQRLEARQDQLLDQLTEG